MQSGLGFTQSGAATTATGAAGSAGSIIAASSAGGPVGTAIGLAITGITLAVTAFLNRKRPQQKIKATQIANEYEALMQQNLAAWVNSSHTWAEKSQALTNFDAMWADFVRTVSDPALGDPGSRAVPERSRGGIWDWFSYYRDPIEASAIAESAILGGGIDLGLFLGLGALVAGIWMLQENK